MMVCTAISLYRLTRDEVREMVDDGRFVKVFVNTPLDLFEQPDVKGVYAQARCGAISVGMGIDDPYEAPLFVSLTLPKVKHVPEENAMLILNYLINERLVRQSRMNLKAENSEPARPAVETV